MSASSGRLDGKVTLVTGAGGGIGAETATLFREHGAHVFALDLDPRGNPDVLQFDVGEEAQWKAMVERVLEEHGVIDVLVNNAGIVRAYEGIIDVAISDWEAVMRVNLYGTFLGMRSVIPAMRRARRGSIVNFASIWGDVGTAGVSAYQASKGAVRTLTKNAAVTYAADNIRANAILPGLTMTPMIAHQDEELTARLISNTPLGRAAHPREVAFGALFLASDESSFMTGAEMVIDGGYLAI